MRIRSIYFLPRHTEATAALLLFLFLLSSNASAASGTGANELWKALKAGTAFVVMRHAIAPGTGDPENFKLRDCSTQRNLSDQGREQARRAGRILRSHGVDEALIYSSQWCRCQETAKLLAVGQVRDLASLNSFYESYERRAEQTRHLKSWLGARPTGKPLILVTHQVNISALTGNGTQSGEIVFVESTSKGGYSVLGRIVP
ncbi:MAG: phosphohistidine phosphatase SixA [Alphaproteobacteria bacterium]|jgi:phosphohistidine phosphatase SixA